MLTLLTHLIINKFQHITHSTFTPKFNPVGKKEYLKVPISKIKKINDLIF